MTAVAGVRIEIGVPAEFSSKYEVSDVSDSGALWVERGTLAAVALHVAGSDTGPELAIGMRIADVLGVLGLRLV